MKVRTDVSLASYTTLQVGGAARYLCEVRTLDDLREALDFAREHTAAPPVILGGGSNILIPDSGTERLVIINRFSGYEVISETKDAVLVKVGAGEVLDEVIERTITDGYWGLENLSSIPGSVGATPIQNIGAYGVEVETLIETVEAVSCITGDIKTFTHEACAFGYRDSFFKTPAGKEWCVTAVVYRLSKTPNPILTYADLQSLAETSDAISQQTIRDTVVTVRANKFPDWTQVGTAGSFFKNPILSAEQYQKLQESYPDLPGYVLDESRVKVPLGWILDNICSLKGYRQGAVRLFEKQALVLVAEAGADAAAIESFVIFVQETVQQKTGISIEREVLSLSE